MAATSSSTRGGDEDVPLEELIFSCSICSATVSDVYKTGESNKGFHSGSGDDDGLVTKMWIADCSHVTCSKHLEGGGRWCGTDGKVHVLTPRSRTFPPEKYPSDSIMSEMHSVDR